MIKRGCIRWQYYRVSMVVRGVIVLRYKIMRPELAEGLARRWRDRFGAEETILEGAREIAPPYTWTLIARIRPTAQGEP